MDQKQDLSAKSQTLISPSQEPEINGTILFLTVDMQQTESLWPLKAPYSRKSRNDRKEWECLVKIGKSRNDIMHILLRNYIVKIKVKLRVGGSKSNLPTNGFANILSIFVATTAFVYSLALSNGCNFGSLLR